MCTCPINIFGNQGAFIIATSNNVELRSTQGQDGKEDELTLCVVDSVGRGSRVSSNAVVGRKPRWDRPTRRGGGEPQRGFGQESGVGYSDRGPEGDPACHQFELSKKAMAGRQGLRSIFSWQCALHHFNSSQQTIVNLTLKSTHQISGILPM